MPGYVYWDYVHLKQPFIFNQWERGAGGLFEKVTSYFSSLKK